MGWFEPLRGAPFTILMMALAILLPLVLCWRVGFNPDRLTRLATALMIVVSVVMVTLIRVRGEALLLAAVLPTLLVATPSLFPKCGVRLTIALLLLLWSFPLMAALVGLLYWPAAIVLAVADMAQFERDALTS